MPAENATGHEHVAELRDGGVGQHFLDVGLGNADGRCKQSGERSNDRDHHHCHWRALENHGRACHHINARRYHGCRMDQRRDWRRAFHGVRQPDIKRDLGRLAGRADHQQQPNRREQPGAASFRRQRMHRSKDSREVERSEMLDHQEERNQESKITDPVDDECFLAGRRR
jgi:hypothetical protein